MAIPLSPSGNRMGRASALEMVLEGCFLDRGLTRDSLIETCSEQALHASVTDALEFAQFGCRHGLLFDALCICGVQPCRGKGASRASGLSPELRGKTRRLFASQKSVWRIDRLPRLEV